MSQRLFDSEEKIGVFCDGFHPRMERQKGGDEVKVIDMSLRVQPFSSELAAQVFGDGLVKRTLFKHLDGSALPGLDRVTFTAKPPRQLMTVFAAPDTEQPSFAFDQVDVSKLTARTEKGVEGWALVFHATYGPAGDRELGQMQDWFTTQRFCVFLEAQPLLDFEEDGMTDADEKAQHAVVPNPESQATQDAKRSVGANRKLHSHQAGKKKGGRRKPVVDPEAGDVYSADA